MDREPHGPAGPVNSAPDPADPGAPARTRAVRRAAIRLCLQAAWAPLEEVALPNGRRADILALRPDGEFVCIEVKSGPRDFLSDAKWPEYREVSDALYFAVDADFPQALLPDDVGLIVAADSEAALLRAAPEHRMPPARRRAMLARFAALAATRLALTLDPGAAALLRDPARAE